MMRNKHSKTKFMSQLKRMTGQAMIEYALILVLLAVAFGVALAATGPAIGNVFSNTVFQLLQQTPEGEGLEVVGPVEFWRTVTAVAQTPESARERPIPSRTPAPPTSTPTMGPSPTPTPTIPTNTPIPSNTPFPTNTPVDITRVAPYLDTVDEPELWRVDASVFIGTDDWCGEYFPNTDLSGESVERCNREDGRQFHGKLDYDWGPNGPFTNWPQSSAYNNFSVRWTKPIYLDPLSWPDDVDEVNIVINVNHDDGMRVKLGGTTVYDNWNSPNSASIPVTVPVGEQTDLVVEYREETGDAAVSVRIGISSNAADTRVDNDGNPIAGTSNCNWGRKQHMNDTYSAEYMWDEYADGRLPEGNRCYLEFRGAVYIPDTDGVPDADTKAMIMPQMVFWDVWDMDNANGQRGWLEIAEYIDNPAGSGQVDYEAMTWQRVDLRQGGTENYNWTRNVIDLTDVNGVNFSGKNVAFRFVMENSGWGWNRKWYIDDIEFRDAYDVTQSGSELREFSVGEYWNVDLAEQANDFFYSRPWAITCTDMSYGFGGSCSWEDSPGDAEYKDFSEASGWSTDLNDSRVHFLEFKGWINIPNNGLGDPDYEGDTGDGLLTFYHAYNLGRRTGLEVQYTTDPHGIGPANWQPVPGIDPDKPEGVIIDRNNDDDLSRTVMEKEEISLGEIPATRFRLRFAMTVRSSANLRDGWWIDEIRIEREGNPRFLDYPFFDGAEEGIANWQTVGDWGRTNLAARTDQHSFTDSPGEDNRYESNTNTTLEFRWALDLHNDTPENLILYDRNDAGGNSNAANPGVIAPPAEDPILTFWHRRDLDYSDDLHVEYRFATDDGDDWKNLWSYIFRMGTLRYGDWNARSGTQWAWERVEIDLSVIMREIPTVANAGTGNDLRDDDLYIRFRLEADGSNTNEGVWIDDIRIEERNEKVYYLWDEGVTPEIGGEILDAGSGRYYFDDIDNGDWWERWYAGGGWEAIDWEQNSGIYAMHESPTEQQIRAPGDPIITTTPSGDRLNYQLEWPELTVDGNRDISGDNPEIATPHDTFQVLQMQTIFDLRGTLADTAPTLYFWTRFYPGDDDRLSVEVSYELTGDQNSVENYMNDRCRSNNRLQCYEHQYGWSEWQEMWYERDYAKGWGWTRQAVDLSDWAAEDIDSQGTRVRIRFVVDAYDRNNQRDGWYIDDVEVGPRRDQVIHTLSQGGFFDGARDMSNWIGDGLWGLSPELHRGDAGGAVSLGFWDETWVDCDDCKNLAPDGTRWRDRFTKGADRFLDSNFNVDGYTGDGRYDRTVVDINYLSRRPVPGFFDEKYSYVGRWTLNTPIIGTQGVEAGEYSFVTYADDGVRMKYEELICEGVPLPDSDGDGLEDHCRTEPVGPDPNGNDFLEWNILYYWSPHPPRPDLGVATFEAGKRYRLTLEFFQDGGGAMITLSAGGAAYSFTDSPKQGAGPAFPDVPSQVLANTSLTLNGTIDLSNTDTPIMQYYTYYEINGGTNAYVEVSTDGGITWTRNGLGRDITDSFGNTDRYDGSRYRGEHLPGEEGDEWRLKRHNLSDYREREIMIRFRLDRRDWNGGRRINNDRNCWNDGDRCNDNGFLSSWWVTDIEIADIGIIP